MKRQTDGRTEGQADGQMHRQTDGRTDEQTAIITFYKTLEIYISINKFIYKISQQNIKSSFNLKIVFPTKRFDALNKTLHN